MAGIPTRESTNVAPTRARAQSFRVEPVTGALGAEILDIDVSQDLDHATVAALRQALLEHGVIFFREQ